MTSSTRVARLMRQADWSVLDGDAVVGTAHGLMRPDGRWFVSIDTWRSEVFAQVLMTVAGDLCLPLHVIVHETDTDELARWLAAGFEPARREHEYDIATDPIISGLGAEPLPEGITLVAADEVDASRLRTLDDELRQDVPGAQGWVNDPVQFRDHILDPRYFDPAVNLVAIDAERQRFAGLVRVWVNPRRARLALIGVTRDYRRAGVCRAMLATVLRRLHERGVRSIAAESDAGNVAAAALLTGAGGRRVGATLELVRPAG